MKQLDLNQEEFMLMENILVKEWSERQSHYLVWIIHCKAKCALRYKCISGRVSQEVIENALSNKPLILEGGGGQLDFTHIDDLVEGITRTLIYKEARSKTFNITYGNARSISDLAKIIKKIIQLSSKAPAAKLKPKRGTLNITRAKELLNFIPNKPMELGYASFVNGILSNGIISKL